MSKKKTRKNHLPDGRHIATVCSEELWILYRQGRAEERMVLKELAFRGDPKPRALEKGYVPFKGGSRTNVKLDTATAQAKPEKPAQASNVRDAKKDKKKGGEGK